MRKCSNAYKATNNRGKTRVTIRDIMDYDCGQVVSVFAFYSDDPSLNPTEVYSFHSVKLFENNEHKQKEAGDGLCKTIGK